MSGQAAGIYDYRVRACNASGCAGYSAVRSTQVIRPPTGVPTLSAGMPTGSGVFTVSWGTVATATEYRLEENATGSWGQIYNAAGCGGYSANRLVVVEPACPECHPDWVPEPEDER